MQTANVSWWRRFFYRCNFRRVITIKWNWIFSVTYDTSNWFSWLILIFCRLIILLIFLACTIPFVSIFYYFFQHRFCCLLPHLLFGDILLSLCYNVAVSQFLFISFSFLVSLSSTISLSVVCWPLSVTSPKSHIYNSCPTIKSFGPAVRWIRMEFISTILIAACPTRCWLQKSFQFKQTAFYLLFALWSVVSESSRVHHPAGNRLKNESLLLTLREMVTETSLFMPGLTAVLYYYYSNLRPAFSTCLPSLWIRLFLLFWFVGWQ